MVYLEKGVCQTTLCATIFIFGQIFHHLSITANLRWSKNSISKIVTVSITWSWILQVYKLTCYGGIAFIYVQFFTPFLDLTTNLQVLK